MFRFKKQVQLNLPKPQWEELGKLANNPQFKAWLALWEDKQRKVEQDFLHKPMLNEFERGKLSGQLKLLGEVISDCKAAGQADKEMGDAQKLRDIEEVQLKEFARTTQRIY